MPDFVYLLLLVCQDLAQIAGQGAGLFGLNLVNVYLFIATVHDAARAKTCTQCHTSCTWLALANRV